MGESELLMPSIVFSIPIVKEAKQNGLLEKYMLQETKKAFSDYFARGGRDRKTAQDFLNSLYIDKRSSEYHLMTSFDLGEHKDKTTLELQKSGEIKRQNYPRNLDSGTWISPSIVEKNFLTKVREGCVEYYIGLFLEDFL